MQDSDESEPYSLIRIVETLTWEYFCQQQSIVINKWILIPLYISRGLLKNCYSNEARNSLNLLHSIFTWRRLHLKDETEKKIRKKERIREDKKISVDTCLSRKRILCELFLHIYYIIILYNIMVFKNYYKFLFIIEIYIVMHLFHIRKINICDSKNAMY